MVILGHNEMTNRLLGQQITQLTDRAGLHVALTKAVVEVRSYHGTPTPYRFLAEKFNTHGQCAVPCPGHCYSEINNRVVDMVVHCDLVCSN